MKPIGGIIVRHARTLATTALVAVLLLSVAAVAWACTAQSRLIGLTPRSAAPGTEVAIKGEGALPGVPVAIYWNEVGTTKLVDTVADTAGNFAAAVVIPQTEAGIYYIVAVPGSAQAQAARAAFEVTAAPATSSSGSAVGARTTNLWSGFASGETSASLEATSNAAGSESNPGSALGMALLAVGAAGIVSGLAVVAGRRRAVAS